MPDIEEAAFLAGPFVGLADAQVGVLYWHRVAGERDHFAAMPDMQVIETCSFEGLVRECRGCVPPGIVGCSYGMRSM